MVYIYECSPRLLDRQGLLGLHNEIHVAFSVISNKKTGYSNHPEVIRYKYNLHKLWERHKKVVKEMNRRGFNHISDLEEPVKDKKTFFSKRIIYDSCKAVWRRIRR